MDNFEKAEILGGISWLHILSCIYIISCFTNVAIACFLSFVNMIQNIRATPMFVYSTDGQSCPVLHNSSLMFRSFHFLFYDFWSLGDKVTKIRKYYVIFVYILKGKMGKTEKNGKKITQLK